MKKFRINCKLKKFSQNFEKKLKKLQESDCKFWKIFVKFGRDFTKICNKYQKNVDTISETFWGRFRKNFFKY